MIIEWLLTLAATATDWFIALWPGGDAPAFIATLDDQVNGFMANAGGMAVWVDWVYVLAVVGVVIAAWAAGLLVKLVLKIAAFVPLFGGSG